MAYMVMEYLEGGELFSRIIDEKNMGKGLGERMTKFYAWQMLSALKVGFLLIEHSLRRWALSCSATPHFKHFESSSGPSFFLKDG